MEHWIEVKMAWSEMDISEIECLSSFINANQSDKETLNQIGRVSNSSVSLVPQHLFAQRYGSLQDYVALF
jgi:hypothetical protein